jgi:hypothetical protein
MTSRPKFPTRRGCKAVSFDAAPLRVTLSVRRALPAGNFACARAAAVADAVAPNLVPAGGKGLPGDALNPLIFRLFDGVAT